MLATARLSAREGVLAAPAKQFRSLAHGLILNVFSDIALAPPPGASSDVITAVWRDWTASYQLLLGDGFDLGAEPAVADVFPRLAFLDALVNRGLQARLDAYKKKVRDIFEPIIDDRRRHLQQQQQQQQESATNNPAAEAHLSMCDTTAGQALGRRAAAPQDFIVRMLHGFVMAIGTSVVFLEKAMAELLTHPHYLIQLQDEMDRAVGRDRLVNDDDLARPNVPLLHAVLMECLRLHPPTPLSLPHCNSQCDAVVAGYRVRIPRGTAVLINVYGIGRNPEVWSDALEAFHAPDMENTGRNLEILTFSAGRRMCPAVHFMSRTLALLLARLVQCFRWELAPGFQVDFTLSEGFIGFLQNPLLVVHSPRLPAHLYDVST